MIDTTVPDVDVGELMQRVRAEAAKIAQRSSRPQHIADARASNASSAAPLPPPPAPIAIRPVTLKRQRLDDLLRHAQDDTHVWRWIPKFLRGLFRKQGGFNRHVLEALTTLVKTNSELTNRVHELSAAQESQAQWLNLLPNAVAEESAAVRAAHHKVTALSAEMTELKTWAQRAGTHLTNLQNAFDAADAQRHLSALQGQLERLGLHVVNLQNEVNAIRDNSRAWADPFRGVERQVEQAGLRINHLEFEIGKNQTETRFAQRTLEQMASRRSSLEQQLSRVDERQAEDAAFIKAIVAEHAALLQRFVADDSAVLQQ